MGKEVPKISVKGKHRKLSNKTPTRSVETIEQKNTNHDSDSSCSSSDSEENDNLLKPLKNKVIPKVVVKGKHGKLSNKKPARSVEIMERKSTNYDSESSDSSPSEIEFLQTPPLNKQKHK